MATQLTHTATAFARPTVHGRRAAAVTGLAGWALLALLERTTDRAARLWSAVALAVVVLSLGARSVRGSTSPAAPFWFVSTCWWQPC